MVGLADPVIHDFQIQNFDTHVNNGSTWLVKFYAPWCKQSQALHPILEEVSAYVNARPRYVLPPLNSLSQSFSSNNLYQIGRTRGTSQRGRTSSTRISFLRGN